ncbi:MAG: YafY family transcriptional regulator, partial [Acidimicrobiaceae bacterium]|nr:YafY family transcriptional regulator [Acidimicrobiaceae bacterium]
MRVDEHVARPSDSGTRLLRLLGLLQRRPSWTGSDLADRLSVDERTVRRDIERLRDLGYQVDSTRGAAGGYRLGVGTDLPPLLLEDDEAMAVAVVLGASASAAVPGMEQGALGALTKLDRLLPERLRSQLGALRASIDSLASPRGEPVSSEALVLLAQACDSHLLAMFSYQAQDGRKSNRRVEPHRLVATDRRWYLVSYDLDRADWRTFRVDRMGSVTLPGHTFVPRPLADPARLVAEGITTAPYTHRAVVRFEAPRERLAQRISSDAAIIDEDGPYSRVEIGADDLNWLAGYLVRLGIPFEVLEPAPLREHLADLGVRLQQRHSTSGTATP